MGSLPRPSFEPAKPWVSTPLKHSIALSNSADCQVWLKLENLQPSGSFKSRGVGNLLLRTLVEDQERLLLQQEEKDSSAARDADADQRPRPHFYSSSGGNAGLACVTAAKSLDCVSTVVVPLTTSEFVINNIRTAGASEVIQTGANWAEADRYLREELLGHGQNGNEGQTSGSSTTSSSSSSKAIQGGKYYIPPFDHPLIWTGNSSIIHELPRRPRAIICSVGGGGLFCGIMQGLSERGWLSSVSVIAVETSGADSLATSVAADKLVTLPRITSIANTLGATRVAEQAFQWAARTPGAKVTSVVLTDRDAIDGVETCARWERILVEPACGVCFALFDGGRHNQGRRDRLKAILPDLKEDDEVVVVVCGGSNITVDLMNGWKRQFEGAEVGMRIAKSGEAGF